MVISHFSKIIIKSQHSCDRIEIISDYFPCFLDEKTETKRELLPHNWVEKPVSHRILTLLLTAQHAHNRDPLNNLSK